MNAVLDTNVVAYYLLGAEPFAAEAARLRRAVRRALAPAHWAAGVANPIRRAVRGALVREEGHLRLDPAARLDIEPVALRELWQGALARSMATEVAVCDTLLVEPAACRRLPPVTFDDKVPRVFPDLACRPGRMVAG
jgi:predicted nucleic acid-binding protein